MEGIVIKGLRKSYGKFTAVDGIDLTVKEGELFALLGENGAGKTTTIKVLCSLCGFDGGKVSVLGHDLVKDKDKIKSIVNLSPQESAVANNLTVIENLKFTCELYGIANEEEIIREAIKKFSLTEVKGKRAKTLSGGYKRRLSIAMALITEPKILFLDEPTLGLDVRSRRELWKIIGELKGKVTILLTTHYIEEAEALSDRIAVMKKGRIIALGTSDELKKSANTDDIEEAFLRITETCL